MIETKPLREDSHLCSQSGSWSSMRGWDRYVRFHTPSAKNLEASFCSILQQEIRHFPSLEMSRGVLGGTPRIVGTRIPVSMVLDAIEFYGTLEGALKSYPDLTIDQVKQAVSFSASVLECRIVEEKP